MEKILARSCVYAKIGELVQGKLTPTEHIIIPGITSSFFNTKTFIYESKGIQKIEVRPFVYPAIYLYLKLKNGSSLDELRLLDVDDLEFIKNELNNQLDNITIIQNTNIPEGKGLSSGPTDIISLLLALNKYFSTQFNKETIYQICAIILPTDPVLDDEINLIFNPVKGEKVFNLVPRDFGVIYFDSEKEKSFNSKLIFKDLEYTSQEYVDFNTVLELYQNGSILNDVSLVYEAITMSSKINQRINPKPKFDLLLEYAKENKLGVFVGHTGTVMGLVTDSLNLKKDYENAFKFIESNWNVRPYFDLCQKSLLSIS